MPYRNVHPSFAARSWTCWLLAGRWRLCQLILVCRTRPFTTGDARTLSTAAWSRSDVFGEGGTESRSSSDHRTGDRAGRDPTSQRTAESPGGVRRGRYEAIRVMRDEGQRSGVRAVYWAGRNPGSTGGGPAHRRLGRSATLG